MLKKLNQLTFIALVSATLLACKHKDSNLREHKATEIKKYPLKSFFVSPSATQFGTGTLKEPFSSLEDAQNALRSLEDPSGYTVFLLDGDYSRQQSLKLNSSDSGTASAPITWRADNPRKAIINGGKNLKHSWFKPVQDQEFLKKLVDPSSRSRILVADLLSHGIDDYGQITRHGWCMEKPDRVPPAVLSIGHQRMTLARWPNKGEAHPSMKHDLFYPIKHQKGYLYKMSQFVPTVKHPGQVTMEKVIDPGPATERRQYYFSNKEAQKRGGSFSVSFDRMKYWNSPEKIWLDGVLSATWEWTYNKIASVDNQAKTITLAYGELNGLGQGSQGTVIRPHFHFENVPEEIDRPGEYFIDREKGLLYLYPPTNFASSPITLATSSQPLFSIHNAKHINFDGLFFNTGRHLALEIKDSENITIKNATIANFVKGGVKIKGSHNKVINSHIYGVGGYGVYLDGGNKTTLKAGMNSVESCEIHDFGWEQKSQIPGVFLNGVGNSVRHCKIYDAPHFAIRLRNTNDCIVAHNEIFDLPKYHHYDGGAIYLTTGHQPQCRGNKISHNYLHDIPTNGIYADNFSWGVLVNNNLFERVGNTGFKYKAVNMNGGGQCLTQNNIMLDCFIPYGQGARPKDDSWLKDWGKCFKRFGNNRVHRTPYKKYKDFLFFLETKDLNEHYRSSSTVTNNIFLNPSIDFHDSAKKLKGLVDSSGKLIYSKNLSTKNQLGKLDWHQKGFVEKARKSLQQ